MHHERKDQRKRINIEEIPDPSAVDPLDLLIDAIENVERDEQAWLLRRRLGRLDAQRRQVLKGIYGFGADGELSAREIGKRMGVKHPYVVRLHEQGLEQMRGKYGVSDDEDSASAA